MTEPASTPAENVQTRLPFDQEYLERTTQFGHFLCTALPELSGLIVVPIWRTLLPGQGPSGMLLGADGPPRSIDKLLPALRAHVYFLEYLVSQVRPEVHTLEQFVKQASETILAADQRLREQQPPAAGP